VPAIIVSPHAKARVNHTVFDHTSILRAIEWRWGLRPLTRRDGHANNIVSALDFSTTRIPPSYGVIAPPPPTDCSSPSTGTTGESSEWAGLKKLALREGWVLPS
jgi:phospholipase C